MEYILHRNLNLILDISQYYASGPNFNGTQCISSDSFEIVKTVAKLTGVNYQGVA